MILAPHYVYPPSPFSWLIIRRLFGACVSSLFLNDPKSGVFETDPGGEQNYPGVWGGEVAVGSRVKGFSSSIVDNGLQCNNGSSVVEEAAAQKRIKAILPKIEMCLLNTLESGKIYVIVNEIRCWLIDRQGRKQGN